MHETSEHSRWRTVREEGVTRQNGGCWISKMERQSCVPFPQLPLHPPLGFHAHGCHPLRNCRHPGLPSSSTEIARTQEAATLTVTTPSVPSPQLTDLLLNASRLLPSPATPSDPGPPKEIEGEKRDFKCQGRSNAFHFFKEKKCVHGRKIQFLFKL